MEFILSANTRTDIVSRRAPVGAPYTYTPLHLRLLSIRSDGACLFLFGRYIVHVGGATLVQGDHHLSLVRALYRCTPQDAATEIWGQLRHGAYAYLRAPLGVLKPEEIVGDLRFRLEWSHDPACGSG